VKAPQHARARSAAAQNRRNMIATRAPVARAMLEARLGQAPPFSSARGAQ
jgi:transcription elongation GreA/GreB family factor